MRPIALILAGCSLVHAADLIELARSAAPEFFADTVLRQVEGGKIADRASQITLLEDSFTALAGAREPVRLTAIFGTPVESRAMYRSKASELGLDALSLRSRIVRAMLTIDRAKAREMFGRIPRPAIEPRPCEDPLVADASAYYETAGAVSRSALSGTERVQFLQALLAGAQSPNELASFARAIQSVELKPPEWELLLDSLSLKLETLAADYRPFALSIPALREDVEHLAGRAHAPLAQGFRTYLVSQLRAPRCTEDFGEAAQVVEWFNSSFRSELPVISERETQPSKREGSIMPDAYFESEDSKDLGAALTRLQFGPEGKPRGSADRSTSEWRERLADFLRDQAAWKPTGTAVDVLHQKAYVLRAVLALTAPGDDRDRIISTYVALLKSSEAQRQSPAEWLYQVRALLQAASGDMPKLMQEFLNSGDVGLILTTH